MNTFKKGKSIREFSRYISKYKARFYSRYGFRIIMGRREGIYFWDVKGKRYINLHCNGGVFNLGHRNKTILKAVKDAMDDYDIGNHHLMSGPRAQLAKELSQSFRSGWLSSKFKEQIDKTVFAVSGGEAVDLAIKIARGYTKQKNIISISGGYHGHTGLALCAGDEKYRKPFGIGMPDFIQIDLQDIDKIENFITNETAAVILETTPATLGMPILKKETVQNIRRLCSKKAVVLILDEIQTGLGRTGLPWGFQHYNILPDIVVTGKGLSGGVYPIAATCFRKKYERVFKKDPFIHISTFGGAELACFGALQVLRISTNKEFLANVNRLAEFFSQELNKLMNEFSCIVEIRQLGLFIGIVFEDFPTCLTMVKTLADNGIFAVYANNDKRVLQFLPPLIINSDQAREIITILRKSLQDQNRTKYKLIKKAVTWIS